jgi:hypothetical protein
VNQLTKESFQNKPLFKEKPAEDADVSEWRNWALRLEDWTIKLEKQEEQRRKKLKRLRNELHQKNKVFIYYKGIITDFSDTIDKYEASWLIQIRNRISAFLQREPKA